VTILSNQRVAEQKWSTPRDLAVDSSDYTIIAKMRNLVLDLIAEIAGTKEQQRLLAESGCTHYQG